jgi:hypothetical protein
VVPIQNSSFKQQNYFIRCYFDHDICIDESRDTVVCIATNYGLDDLGVEFESRKGQELSLLHVVQTGSGAHPASYSMGTGGSFPGAKVARA